MKIIITQDDLAFVEPLEPGLYDAVIERVVTEAPDDTPLVSRAGNPMIRWDFRIVGPAERVKNRQVTLPYYTVTSSGKNQRLIRLFQAFGAVEANKAIDPLAFVGKRCSVLIGLEADPSNPNDPSSYRNTIQQVLRSYGTAVPKERKASR